MRRLLSGAQHRHLGPSGQVEYTAGRGIVGRWTLQFDELEGRFVRACLRWKFSGLEHQWVSSGQDPSL